jgi:hypothetical protein
MTQTRVFEGTWEELAVYAPALRGKKLRLTIVEDVIQAPARVTEEDRIAAIRAGMGKFADPSRMVLASEELRRERQQDDARLERKLRSSPK